MATRLAALLPRFVVVTLLWVLATATLTFAASKNVIGPLTPKKAPAAAQQKPVLVVPDVRHQVYVFAEGMLDDAGFGWRVVGGARGYASNVVVAQTPAPGTRVIDTGAPAIGLTLAHGSSPQTGTPMNASPGGGTRIEFADAPVVKPLAPARPKVAKRKVAKPKAKAKRTHVPKARAKRTHVPKVHPKKVVRRPAAFSVPGARKEPLDEMPLPARARLLEQWVAARPTRNGSNVHHWLYQHAWIVTGARFGWWHGAEALQTLIRVDRRVEAMWGIGARSEAVARAALAYVEAHTK
jgi:hypothetical protein